jgi:hypothetical protein
MEAKHHGDSVESTRILNLDRTSLFQVLATLVLAHEPAVRIGQKVCRVLAPITTK